MVAPGEEEIEVDFPFFVFFVAHGAEPPYAGSTYYVTLRDGKYYLPAATLWDIRREDFAQVGYALSLEGWQDPIAFLKSHLAHVDPAPFLPVRRMLTFFSPRQRAKAHVHPPPLLFLTSPRTSGRLRHEMGTGRRL
jgi:hypothetical protein